VRTIWYDRWSNIKINNIETIKIKIPIEQHTKYSYIAANLIKPNHPQLIASKNTVIIVSHGYSDTKETLQYLYLPLALQGYVILAYDARGTAESRKLGKRNQFLERIEDYKKILDWIQNKEEFNHFEICSIGFSIGALIAVAAAFTNEKVKKIIGISLNSRYKKNVLRANPLILLSYLIKGIKLFPTQEEIEKLSPYLIFKNYKKKVSEEKWNQITNRIFLIHSKNDSVIRFSNFQENQSILELPPNNTLIFKKGGHIMKKNELALVGGIMQFLNN
jgi:esterase/lipase